MSIHKEITFEDEICTHLGVKGWIYEEGAASRYDRARALFPDDLVAWVQDTQPDAWDSLTKEHGAKAKEVLCDRLRATLDKVGTAVLLRNGLDVAGLKVTLSLCQFRPALAMNADLQARHAANRLRVIRQVRYTLHSGESIDLVLFLNGIPVATAELKSDYTQSVGDAVDQYRFDRPPRSPKGNVTEPLLAFPGGAIVHFAVSNSAVRMCTRLAGPDSVFLPFDRGHDFGAGNPPNLNGPATAYLWQEVWAREGWLEILGRYVAPIRNEKKQPTGWLFPRYHQLDATRLIVASVRQEGAGGRYLIEHSAGSGKTNSIAWAAHFLADLHDAENRKMFDTVLVVSDRTVLDKQLRRAIEGLERTPGVVAVVTGDGGSKSEELAAALSAGKKVVVCTIQTFPFAIDAVRNLALTSGRRFAVIADEAHSSQSGKAAAELKAVLTAEERDALSDGAEVSAEEILAAKMAARADGDGGITYLAFTATPKAKTLEMFGRRPDPDAPAGPGNLPRSFHVYSMRQAIEEGFILDVLRNYTSWKMAFRLTHDGQDFDEREVDAHEAKRGIMGWVRLHPTNIAHRVQIVVEHFRQNVAHLLGGQAKAMVVTASRKEAVRWTKQMADYIAKRGYGIGLLVAFSGEVEDPETAGGPFSETTMNPTLAGRDIRDVFATPQYSILLVANKFQTGFDQPLLSAMYVDRKLGGVQAVQTLSRLNRSHPGKDTTYVVDFVNEPGEILAAFRQYHVTASLSDVSDPNVVLDLRNKLDALGLYDEDEVDRVAMAVVRPGATQAQLDAAIGPVSHRIVNAYRAARQAVRTAPPGSQGAKDAKDEADSLLLFRGDLGAYIRAYEFLGQMFDYGNTAYEKLYIFARMLLPLLGFERERPDIDLSALRLTHHRMRDLGQQALNLGGSAPAPGLAPIKEAGSGQVQDRHKMRLAAIVQAMNDLFEGEVSEGDAVSYVETIRTKMMEAPVLQEQAAANGKEQFSSSPSLQQELLNAVIGAMTAHESMSRQALNSEAIRTRMLSVLLGAGGLWEGLRDASGPGAAPPI